MYKSVILYRFMFVSRFTISVHSPFNYISVRFAGGVWSFVMYYKSVEFIRSRYKKAVGRQPLRFECGLIVSLSFCSRQIGKELVYVCEKISIIIIIIKSEIIIYPKINGTI